MYIEHYQSTKPPSNHYTQKQIAINDSYILPSMGNKLKCAVNSVLKLCIEEQPI